LLITLKRSLVICLQNAGWEYHVCDVVTLAVIRPRRRDKFRCDDRKEAPRAKQLGLAECG